MKFSPRRNESQVIIKGLNSIAEALDAGKSLERIFIQKENRREGVASIIRLAREREIPIQFVPAEKLQQLGAAHQGIAATVSPVSFFRAEDVVSQAIERGELPLLIICDRITDVRNFGAIA